jgi:diphthine synthase
MLYLIGLGLNAKGISKEGLLILEKCKKIYLEKYTVDFPYNLEELRIGKEEIIELDRKDVESNRLIKEAKSKPIALLVYGCPLFATTHISLILDAEKQGVETKVIYSASVFDAVSETGLQLYKFGKTASMPAWKDNFRPDSFLDIVKQNQGIQAHSLILIDIGLKFKEALTQLDIASKNKVLKIDKIIVGSNLGTEQSRILYGTTEELKKVDNIKLPVCFVIPSELHFIEKEAIERFKI